MRVTFVIKEDKYHHLRHKTDETKELGALLKGLHQLATKHTDWDCMLGKTDQFAVEAGCPLEGWPHVCSIIWKTNHDGERKRYGEGWKEIPTATEVENWALIQLSGKGLGHTRSGVDF